MNVFDAEVMNFVNQLSRHSLLFDKMVVLLSCNKLLKGGILAVLVWWGWYERKERYAHNRMHIVATLLSCVVAMALTRTLATVLPFRARPLHEQTLDFQIPYGLDPTILSGWSSFPSDHATLFFALATGLLFVSRQAGIFAVLYTLIVISLPRIYLGFHYPTDIIAGAMIGISVALVGNICLVKRSYLQSITSWMLSRPALMYPFLFLFTYQIVDQFDASRAIGSALLRMVKLILA